MSTEGENQQTEGPAPAKQTQSCSKAKGQALDTPLPPPSPSPEGGGSSSNDKHIASSKKNFTPQYKLSSIPKLTGTEDYRHWRDISQYVLELFNCWDILLETDTIDQYDEDEDYNTFVDFQGRYQYAATYFIQTVDPTLLIILTTQKTPSKIWTTLEDKFSREHTSSFFDQLNSVFDTKYDASDPISEHINKYDTQWNRLQLRCATATASDRYALPFAFKSVFESTEAKAALLLHSLPESMNNIVDNVQTKEDLIYDHVYRRLLDLKTPSAVNSADNKAYKSADGKGKGKAPGRKPLPKGPSAPRNVPGA